MRINDIKAAPETRGSTIVEFALVFMVLFAMMLGIIDFGRAIYAYHAVANAAREATRFAAIRGHASCTTTPRTWPTSNCPLLTGDVSNFVSSQLTAQGIFNNITSTPSVRGDLAVTTTWSDPLSLGLASCLTASTPTIQDPGCMVKVQIQYKFGFTIPYWTAYQSAPPPAITMTSTSQFVISQ